MKIRVRLITSLAKVLGIYFGLGLGGVGGDRSISPSLWPPITIIDYVIPKSILDIICNVWLHSYKSSPTIYSNEKNDWVSKNLITPWLKPLESSSREKGFKIK